MFWTKSLVNLVMAVVSVLTTSWAWAESTYPASAIDTNWGSWTLEFRLCVRSEVDTGIPLEEARQSCAYLLRLDSAPTFTSPSAQLPETNNFGTWLYEFRLCVQSGLEAGLPLEEVRSSCSSLSEHPAQ